MIDLEAILLLRYALSSSPATFRLSVLHDLAGILETRFKVNGRQSDFEEATSLRQEIFAMSN